MPDHYSAFISYRHAELDIHVAEEVQKLLEHYHIPKEIQKSKGLKNIPPIFRDKNELPITSNLDADISEALENSEYLIVICSTHTNESIWVSREIEYFLKSHSKSQILTILADGEPQEVIPEVLLTDTVTRKDINGVEYIEQIPIEPLSCDLRKGIKKSKKDEIPRLAAALIGCSYDELVQRQKQYMIKRLAAILSVAFILVAIAISYLVWSTIRIRDNYYDALKNKAKFLATESTSLLEDEQRITAIQLALAALPSEADPDMPVTSEAEYALTMATRAYVAENGSTIDSTWNYQCADTVSDYVISPNRKYLAAYDSSSNLYIWNLEDNSLVYDDHTDTSVNYISFTENDNLIVIEDSVIYCMDCSTGSQIWTSQGTEIDSIYYGPNADIVGNLMYLATVGNGIFIIDCSDGTITNRYDYPDYISHVSSIKVNSDGSKLIYSYDTEEDIYRTGCCDLLTGEFYTGQNDYGYISDVFFVTDDTFIAVNGTNVDDASYGIYNTMVLSNYEMTIDYIDCVSQEYIWQSNFETDQVNLKNGLLNITYTDENGQDVPAIVFYSGNKASVYSINDGSELNTYNFNVPLINATGTNNSNMYFFTSNGQIGIIKSNENGKQTINLVKYFANDLNKLSSNNAFFVHQRGSSDIICYDINVYDDQYSSFSEDRYEAFDDYRIFDDYLVVTFKEDDINRINFYDLNSKAYKASCKFDDDITDIKILDDLDGNIYVIANKSSGEKYDVILYSISPETGEIVDEGNLISGSDFYIYDYFYYKDNYIYYYDGGGEKSNIYRVCLTDESMLEYNLESFINVYSLDPVISNDLSMVLLGSMDETIELYNFESNELTTLSNSLDSYEYAVFSEDNKYLYVATDDEIFAYDTNASTEIWNTSTNGLLVYSLYHRDGVLYALYSDGSIYRYEESTGNLIGRTEIMINTSFMDMPSEWYFDDDNHTLIVSLGRVTCIINTEDWIMSAYMSSCFGYNSKNDIFCSYSLNSDFEYNFGYFRHYSVEELIEKGYDIIGSSQLSEDILIKYGLK